MNKKPIFQKRHYEFLAKVINRHFRWADAAIWANYLAEDNPQFDINKFLKAVYKEDEPKPEPISVQQWRREYMSK